MAPDRLNSLEFHDSLHNVHLDQVCKKVAQHGSRSQVSLVMVDAFTLRVEGQVVMVVKTYGRVNLERMGIGASLLT